jgi:phosphoribosylamine--glycine ligase
MARLKTDLVTVIEHAVNGTLKDIELDWDRRTALGVVLAAAGYPDAPRKGDTITGIPAETQDSMTFHAGTVLDQGVLKTAGGRVLCVVGLGDSVRVAQKHAYEAAEQVRFEGMQFRHDIGWRALKRPS